MTIKFNFPHVSEYDELARVPSRTNLYDENGNVITDEQNGIKSDITMKPMCFKGDMNLAVEIFLFESLKSATLFCKILNSICFCSY